MPVASMKAELGAAPGEDGRPSAVQLAAVLGRLCAALALALALISKRGGWSMVG